jgi:hypothetical protein
MHPGNHQWLEQVRVTYPGYFDGASVLEIGSYNVNGSARQHFKKPKRYVGVDREKGPDVDIVSEAVATSFKPGEFDTLVYLSVFEHDPKWAEGFSHNLKWLRNGGLILVCWGAEGNTRHPPEPWAPVPIRDFMNSMKNWPVLVEDAFFEATRYKGYAVGCFNVVAKKATDKE